MQDTQARHRDQATLSTQERALLIFSAVATGLLLAWILHYSRYGIDFTDESFYLVWMSNPFLFDWSLTQFGFVYHPLYRALGGDIASLRQANIGIIFLLSWWLTALVLDASSAGNTRSRLELTIVSAGFAVASLVVFSWWLTTPNYNTLTFQALLIASIGIVLANKSAAFKSVFGWLLIGGGGWLAFMAKPSSALALATCTLVFLLASRKFSLRLLCVSVAVALLLLLMSAWLIDGSIQGFIERLRTALAFYEHLGAGHTFSKSFRLGEFSLSGREKTIVLLTAALVFAGTWYGLLASTRRKVLAMLVSFVFFSATIAIMGNAVMGSMGLGDFRNLIIWSIALACALLALAARHKKRPENLRPSQLPLALLFVVMPYVFAFGSNGNYWWVAGFVGMFGLLGGIVLLGPLAQARGEWGFVLPLVFATQALSALLLQAGLNQPYRQPQPLSLNDSAATMGRGQSSLMLSAGFAEYVKTIQQAARESGLAPGTPVIDLTGQSPGVLYAMQAKSIGQPWMVGGYPGSQKLAEVALAQVPCEWLATAWLLVEEFGPRHLPTAVVASYGANFKTHFELAATWQTAPGAGGYAEPREQKLFKPLDTAFVLAECRNKSQQTPSP